MKLLQFIKIEVFLRKIYRNFLIVFYLKNRIVLSFALLQVFLPSFLRIYFAIVFVSFFCFFFWPQSSASFCTYSSTSARLIVIQIEFALLSLASFALLQLKLILFRPITFSVYLTLCSYGILLLFLSFSLPTTLFFPLHFLLPSLKAFQTLIALKLLSLVATAAAAVVAVAASSSCSAANKVTWPTNLHGT